MIEAVGNLKAFLDVIAYAEGTKGIGDDGYDVLVGYGRFDDYSDHPRKLVRIANLKLWSSAAGRYQILERTYDYYAHKLELSDFTPETQDKIAIQIVFERMALGLIVSGDFEGAVSAVRRVWASLPGADYGQPERDIKTLLAKFVEYGGRLK